MSAPEKPKPQQGDKTPPPVGPPPLADTPPPTLHERPHSPAAADPPEGETQPVATDYGSIGGIITKEKISLEATPRSGLDLGRQVLEGSGGSEHHEQRVRERAYQIWEREGATGDPEDHWYSAERELKDAT